MTYLEVIVIEGYTILCSRRDFSKMTYLELIRSYSLISYENELLSLKSFGPSSLSNEYEFSFLEPAISRFMLFEV